MIDLKFSVHEIFTHVVHVCSRHGYVNQDKALIEQTQPTSERIKQSLFENHFAEDSEEYHTATNMIEWLSDNTKSGTGSFLDMCREFLNTGIEDFSNIGTLASLYRSFKTYQFNVSRFQKLKLINFIDEFYGVKTIDYTIQLKYLFYTKGNYPLNGYDYFFKDDDGHKFRLHKSKRINLVKNDWYQFTGKVKQHVIELGQKTTVLRGKRNDLTRFYK